MTPCHPKNGLEDALDADGIDFIMTLIPPIVEWVYARVRCNVGG